MFIEREEKSKGRKVQDNAGEMDIGQVMMGLIEYRYDSGAFF